MKLRAAIIFLMLSVFFYLGQINPRLHVRFTAFDAFFLA